MGRLGRRKLVSVRYQAQVVDALIEVEKRFVSIVDALGVLLLIPLFNSSPLLVLTVELLDVGDVGVRVLLNLHHVHRLECLHGVDDSTVTLTLLQTLIQQVNFGICVLHRWHLYLGFSASDSIGRGHSVLRVTHSASAHSSRHA